MILIFIVIILFVFFFQSISDTKEHLSEEQVMTQQYKNPVTGVNRDQHTASWRGQEKTRDITPSDKKEKAKGVMEIEILDDGMNGQGGLLYTPCSLKCCISARKNPDGDIGGKYRASSYRCANPWGQTGCACLTKKQHKHLINRGGNA